MTHLETLVRIGLVDLADEVRPVDLRARVAAARRRRRNRIRRVSFGVAAAVAASAVATVTLWPDPVEAEKEFANQGGSWLPGEIDLTTATPVAPDASLRMIFQVDDGGTLRSFGLVDGSNDVVLLPRLPEFGELWHTRLSADGSRALVHDHETDAYSVVDTRSGVAVQVPWLDHYRAAGLSPDGRSIAVVTLAVMDPEADPPLSAPWGLTILDLATRVTRSIDLPESLNLMGVSSEPSAGGPVWSADGASVVLSMTSGGQFGATAVVSLDGASPWTPSTSALGAAPWSPDSTRLLVAGDAQNAYRVLAAETATGAAGDRLVSGSTYGREPLGWAGNERLLWFDRDLGAVVETDLRGTTVGRPVSVVTSGELGSVLLAPIVAE